MATYTYPPTGETFEGFRWEGDAKALPEWTKERPGDMPEGQPFSFTVEGDVLRVPTTGGFDPASPGDHVIRRGPADFQALRDEVVRECFEVEGEERPALRHVLEEGPGGHVGVHSAEHLPEDEPPWLKARRQVPTSIHNP